MCKKLAACEYTGIRPTVAGSCNKQLGHLGIKMWGEQHFEKNITDEE